MAMAFLFSSLLNAHPGLTIAGYPVQGAFGIVVDHRLRRDSCQEAACVAAELRRMGIRARVERLDWTDVVTKGQDPARLSNLEGMARTLRYRALGSACRSLRATSLFFAHHCDDQYETVLMRLLAGHGYRGLRGIPDANDIPECHHLHGVYKSGRMDHQKDLSRQKPLHRDVQRLRMFLGDREPYLAPLDCEDGGVVVYRPLLPFDKDRLRATCEANGVRWFEDCTNQDPSLTTRNAVRQLTRAHRLPIALQKPAVLALCERIKRRTALEEAECHRLLVREAVVCDFDTNAGTLFIELPGRVLRGPVPRRLHAAARHKPRARRRMLILAMAVRKLIDFVTPELHSPPLGNLGKVVGRLFPELFAKPTMQAPKAFSVAGVKFEPVNHTSTKWFLSRAPYPSNRDLPERKLQSQSRQLAATREIACKEPQATRRVSVRNGETAHLWDGRFWIRVRARVAARFHILPFMPKHAKSFRLALPREERSRLEQVLKRHAPGKVRYSLPALYASQEAEAGKGTAPVLILVALPSLGIQVPGLERWVQYEARYKKVDKSLLGLVRRDSTRKRPLHDEHGARTTWPGGLK